MSTSQTGLLLGGLLPALIFGIAGLFQKWGSTQNLGIGGYVLSVGMGCVTVGLILWFSTGDQNFSFKAAIPALLLGIFWAIGVTAVSLSLSHYGVSLAKIAPLYNMNTLITVVGALFIFSEWKEVHLLRLSLGTLLIVAGGILVSK